MILQRTFFFVPFILFLLVSAAFMLAFDSITLHLYLNRWHTPAMDIFFQYYTHLGDGLFYAMVCLVAGLLRKYPQALYLSVTGLLTMACVQIGKRVFFAEINRPAAYPAIVDALSFVEGVNIHLHHSFPSGHAASIFALSAALVILWNRKAIHGLLFIFSLTVAYSRVYLSQHFFSDIVAGAAIGVLCALVTYSFLKHKINIHLSP